MRAITSRSCASAGCATRGRVLALYLGSNVGNFEPPQHASSSRLLAGALKPGDGLLIGYDLKKDPSILELAYDDPTGVTSAFNKNLLARINRELDADFDLARSRFTRLRRARRGRFVSESDRAQTVRIGGSQIEVPFDAGERSTPNRPTSSRPRK